MSRFAEAKGFSVESFRYGCCIYWVWFSSLLTYTCAVVHPIIVEEEVALEIF
jgi:hypothetical protein